MFCTGRNKSDYFCFMLLKSVSNISCFIASISPPASFSCSFFFSFFHCLTLPSPPGDAYLSQDSPPLDSRCCYCYTCTTHRPSLLPLHSASSAAQVLPAFSSFPHPHCLLTWLISSRCTENITHALCHVCLSCFVSVSLYSTYPLLFLHFTLSDKCCEWFI